MSLTPKQEAFALKYVECGNASEAYRHAYDAEKSKPEVIWVNASKTLANAKVAIRVMELQEKAQERTLITVESLCAELDEDRQLARDEGQASAAISAVMGKAKLNGLLIDKVDQKTKHSADNSVAALMAAVNGTTRTK